MVVDTELASSSAAGLPNGTEVRLSPGSLVMHDMAIGELSPSSFCLGRLVSSSDPKLRNTLRGRPKLKFLQRK